jgi:hypothetical protein
LPAIVSISATPVCSIAMGSASTRPRVISCAASARKKRLRLFA